MAITPNFLLPNAGLTNPYFEGPVQQGQNESIFRLTGGASNGTLGGSVLGANTTAQPKSTPTVNKSTGSNTKTSSKSSSASKSAIAAAKKVAEAQAKANAKQYDILGEGYLQQIDAVNSLGALNLNDLNTAIQGYQGQVANQKQNVWNSVDQANNQALNTAQGVTRSNRNTLRGLGILGSSYAGEKLTEPMQAYDQQRAQIQQQAQSQINDLDTTLAQKTAEHVSLVAQLKQQITNKVAEIQQDIRFSQAQKATALAGLQAAFVEKVQAIAQQNQAMQQQVAQYKADISNSLAQAMATKNPTADLNSIINQAISGADQMTQGMGQSVDLYTPKKEDYSLSGLV
jgi:hypothetical protein